MDKLTLKIQELCSRPFVKKKVVERFLLSIDVYDMRRAQAEASLALDSVQRKWDVYTVQAIEAGIEYIFTEIKK